MKPLISRFDKSLILSVATLSLVNEEMPRKGEDVTSPHWISNLDIVDIQKERARKCGGV